MKIILFFTSLFAFHYCFSQVLPLKEGKVFYEDIDTITNTKNQLYSKCKLWFTNTFKNSKSVIQIDDKEDGQIVGKGNFDVPYHYLVDTHAQCNFTIRIDIKDNKYRLQIYNINYQWAVAGETTMSIEELKTSYKGRYYEKIAPPTNTQIIALINDFKQAMKQTSDDNF